MDVIGQAKDEDLLARTASDPEVSGDFYDHFEADVLAFSYRATRRADLAADLTGEVFAKALESAHAFNCALGSARTWLFGISPQITSRSADGRVLRVIPGFGP